MTSDNRNLLDVLKQELRFIEAGGYRNSPSAERRPEIIFQDPPTCLNFDRSKTIRPCHECTMARLVPSDCLGERFLCRHLPLNDTGFTIDRYDRLGACGNKEAAVRDWLRKRIREWDTPSSASKES